MQARIDAGFARELVEHDAVVPGLYGSSELVREGLRLLHRRAPGDVAAAAHDASRGHVVYLTDHGERLAVIVPAELGPQLERLSPDELAELLEDFADAAAARRARASVEAGESLIPWEQVKAEADL